jgi:hypothetical protein
MFLTPSETIQFAHHMKDKRNNKRMYYLADTERKVIVIFPDGTSREFDGETGIGDNHRIGTGLPFPARVTA